MPAKLGDTVKVHYTGKYDSGEVFDTSEGREPLEFTIGTGQVIAGFDKGVTGMEVGETKTIRIPAGQAYGERDERLVQTIDRKHFSSSMELEVGQRIKLSMQNGDSIIVLVTALTDEIVTLDANHPLAGMDLNFDITLVEIAAGLA